MTGGILVLEFSRQGISHRFESAVGMVRRQLKRMIRWESVIITILGAVLGLAVGVFFGWAAVSAMGDIGVDRLSLPAFRLVMFVVPAGLGLRGGLWLMLRTCRRGRPESLQGRCEGFG